MLKSVHTLICQVSDMDRAIAFYRDVLGLTPGYLSPHWSDFKLGEIRIGLHPPFADPPQGSKAGSWVIGVQTDDIVTLKKTLTSAGGYVVDEYHDTPSGVVLDFQDPDGNALQAIQLGVTAMSLSS